MSRVALNPKDEEKHPVVVCGLDHAMGWFFQVFGPEDEDGEEPLLVDEDSLFNKSFGQTELIRYIRLYAKDDALTRHCIDQISLDLDPQ